MFVKSTNLRRMKRVRRTLNTNIPVFSLGAKQDACFMIYLLKIKEGENEFLGLGPKFQVNRTYFWICEMRKGDFSHRKPNEIFQRIHFLNVLIKPVHLPYPNLLGSFFYFFGLQARCEERPLELEIATFYLINILLDQHLEIENAGNGAGARPHNFPY